MSELCPACLTHYPGLCQAVDRNREPIGAAFDAEPINALTKIGSWWWWAAWRLHRHHRTDHDGLIPPAPAIAEPRIGFPVDLTGSSLERLPVL